MKGATMTIRRAFGFVAAMLILALPLNAGDKGQIQKYFSDAAIKVKAAASATEKRAILNESLKSMSDALAKVQSSGLVSKDDLAGIDRIKAVLQEKQDELAGINGYAPVPDEQLDSFSNYVVQDMEQAVTTITISLVALLLIIILVVLLV